ncbi:MAG: DUF3078 domain-containing protein [Lentimicrobiaceae bacterium]|nr:DUF3078 domain-containing protein [Lentimicrobiaceae bacterium]
MKNLIVCLLMLGLFMPALAQELTENPAPQWATGGNFGLNFTQVSLSNWAAGGENSLATNTFVNLFANYKKGKGAWDNTLNLAYGLLKQGETEVRKSDDKIDFASKYGYSAGKKWYYSGLVSFKSQFTEGFKYPNDSVAISRFLAPGYILLSAGMDYKPSDNFSVYLSPLTGKITLVTDDVLSAQGAYGVEPGDKSRSEFGGYFKMMLKHALMENIDLATKLDLFSNYMDNPQNVDVNWEVMVVMKVNKYISANLSTHLIYDDDIMIKQDDGSAGPRTQFKEVFGVGLTYKF